MIVERFVIAAKPGRAQDFVQLIQEMRGWKGSPARHRIYRPISGAANTVVWEVEFEDFEERQKSRADLFSSPEFPAVRDKWFELEEFGTRVEFFTLVE